jgi:hypothetical protein
MLLTSIVESYDSPAGRKAAMPIAAKRFKRHGDLDSMLHAIGSSLPEYRVKAFKGGGDACNLICDDTHARRHGYKAGLVPGVSIYAYMSRSLVEFLGKDWLDHGYTEVAFHHPAYEGEEIRIAGELSSVTREGTLCIDYRAENPQGLACGTGVARLPVSPPQSEPDLDDYALSQHELRRPISLHSLKAGECLTVITSEFDRKTHWEYCEKTIRDHHPIYQQLVHPGWLLSQANLILTSNYDLPPWIHVSSAVQNYHSQEQECTVETRGRVLEKFELRGNDFIVLDVAVFAGRKCLATIRHTVIFRIAPRVA